MAPELLSSEVGLAHPVPRLLIKQWATGFALDGRHALSVDADPRPIRMTGSDATGEPLVSNGLLGADIIRLAAGKGFPPHTHPGDHLLLVLAGEGTITYAGQVIPTRAGEIFLVEGEVPHAVGAITDHVILAVGSPHHAVGAPDRLAHAEYRLLAAESDRVHCLICELQADLPRFLHDLGCPHCPCRHCNPVEDLLKNQISRQQEVETR